MLRRRVLASGVHGLEDEQDGLLALGVETLLEVAGTVDVVAQPVLALVLIEAAVVVCRAVGQRDGGAGRDAVAVGHGYRVRGDE